MNKAERTRFLTQLTLEALNNGFATVRSEISEVHAETAEMRAAMDTGFTGTYAKFDQIDAEIRNIRADVGDIKRQLGS